MTTHLSAGTFNAGSSPFLVSTMPYHTLDATGPIQMSAVAVDWWRNRGVVAWTIIADNAAPQMTVTAAPKAGVKVRGTVTVTAAGNDVAGIRKVELLGGGRVVATDRSAPWVLNVAAKTQTKTAKVTLRAADRLGNSGSTPVGIWKR